MTFRQDKFGGTPALTIIDWKPRHSAPLEFCDLTVDSINVVKCVLNYDQMRWKIYSKNLILTGSMGIGFWQKVHELTSKNISRHFESKTIFLHIISFIDIKRNLTLIFINTILSKNIF